MARKRTCFASSVCCSDNFLDLPAAAQALYFHLGFIADADGAIDGIRSVLRMLGSSTDDLAQLADAGYLLSVGNVLFITHWWTNNTKNARDYRAGDHQEELSRLSLGNDKTYSLSKELPSDVPCTSEVNRIEVNSIQGEYKGKELNPNKFEKREERQNTPAREPPATAPCPACDIKCAVSAEGDGFRGWCSHHGDFSIDKNGEYA